MPSNFHPSLTDIDQAFTDEIATLGGTVADRYQDETRLLLRSVLPRLADVAPGDSIQGGVALRAVDEGVAIHPYTLRHVCVNGAIAATALETHRVRLVEYESATEFVAAALEEIRIAVRRSAEPEVFLDSVGKMRTSSAEPVDHMIGMMAMLERIPPHYLQQVLEMIRDRFDAAGERTRFDLVNAVTSVARDTADPDLRWKLEEVGGILIASETRVGPRPVLAATRELIGV
jgi:hypothetical protein